VPTPRNKPPHLPRSDPRHQSPTATSASAIEADSARYSSIAKGVGRHPDERLRSLVLEQDYLERLVETDAAQLILRDASERVPCGHRYPARDRHADAVAQHHAVPPARGRWSRQSDEADVAAECDEHRGAVAAGDGQHSLPALDLLAIDP
jgi:hypothetical protein